MHVIPIFVDEDSGEGLYSIKYNHHDECEFDRLFEMWNDTEYIQNYCITNVSYLTSNYFGGITVDQIIDQVLEEAEKLENILDAYAKDGFSKSGNNLQMIFKPLHDSQSKMPILQETKAKISHYLIKRPLLRLYGIRIGVNTYVISGGAIKLTRSMEEHPDTKKELEKLRKVKAFMEYNDIKIEDDLNYYFYGEE